MTIGARPEPLTRPTWCERGHPSASHCSCHCCWLGHAYAANPDRYRYASHLFGRSNRARP
jgi:hypothetical protein